MENFDKSGNGKRLVTVKELANTPGYSCFTEASLIPESIN